MQCSPLISSYGIPRASLYRGIDSRKEKPKLGFIQLARLIMYVFVRHQQPQTNIHIIQGKVESSKSIISTFSHPPELRAIRKKKKGKKSEKPQVTEKGVTYLIPAAIHPPRDTQIHNSHHLYTFGFQPFSSSSALLAFSPASRTSLSILSLARKILLCK